MNAALSAQIAYEDGASNPSRKDGFDALSVVRVREGRGETGLGLRLYKVAK